MFGTGIIVFRETLEAAMIIGILAAATVGIAGRSRMLLGGIAAGVVGAIVVALLTSRIAEMASGTGQDLLNAGILGFAVLMLAWHNIWMSRHGAELAHQARQVGHAVRGGEKTLLTLFVVIALAVLREGSETVLFVYGSMAGGEATALQVLTSGGLGLGAGALAGFLLYAGFLRIPTRWFFAATSGLILLLAAAMASQMARFLVQSDVLPDLGSPLWDTTGMLSNTSAAGVLLHALMGYEAMPSGLQVVFYITTLIVILSAMRVLRYRKDTISES